MFNDRNINGIYYIAVRAIRNSSLKLKVYDRKDSGVIIHNLEAGIQVRGHIMSQEEVAYYTIRLALEQSKVTQIVVNLTPIKGDFVLMANHGNALPRKGNNDYETRSSHLILKLNKGKINQEFVLGV